MGKIDDGARIGWASSSGSFVSNDRDKLRHLPEMGRILRKELRWINQRKPLMQLVAQQAGIDFWHDRYRKDWPEEYKEWFVCACNWDVMYEYITGLRALRDAFKQEGWQPLRPLLLWVRQKNIRLPSREGKDQKDVYPAVWVLCWHGIRCASSSTRRAA